MNPKSGLLRQFQLIFGSLVSNPGDAIRKRIFAGIYLGPGTRRSDKVYG